MRDFRSSSYYEIADIGEDNDGGLRQGLSIPEDLLEDYFADRDPGEDLVGGELDDELHAEEKEGLKKGLTFPGEDSYAFVATEVSTDPTEVDFSTGSDFESSTEGKSTSGSKSFSGNPLTTLQPPHNGHGKREGEAEGEKATSEEGGDPEVRGEDLENEQVEGAGAFLIPKLSNTSLSLLILTKFDIQFLILNT